MVCLHSWQVINFCFLIFITPLCPSLAAILCPPQWQKLILRVRKNDHLLRWDRHFLCCTITINFCSVANCWNWRKKNYYIIFILTPNKCNWSHGLLVQSGELPTLIPNGDFYCAMAEKMCNLDFFKLFLLNAIYWSKKEADLTLSSLSERER